MFQSVSPEEVAERMRVNPDDDFRFIDVREKEELEISRIHGAEHFPMSEISDNINNFDKDEEIIFFCHHGMRSARVCEYFYKQGFKNVKNMTGGIDRWSLTVDPRVPRY